MKPVVLKFDKKRPVFFGFAGLETWETETGHSMNEIEEVMANASISEIIAFTYAGLVGGAKKTNKEIDFDKDDVANWLDEVADLSEIMGAFQKALPNSLSGGGSPQKKRTKA